MSFSLTHLTHPPPCVQMVKIINVLGTDKYYEYLTHYNLEPPQDIEERLEGYDVALQLALAQGSFGLRSISRP